MIEPAPATAPNAKGFFLFILICLISTDAAILLDIPIWRQVLGFVTFTTVPGLLILHALKLDRVSLTEKVVLSVALSISFLMFAGLLINWAYFGLGYETPLSTPSLVLSFSAILVVLAIIARLRNKDSLLHLSDIRLDTKEKALLIPPSIFPLLSILGMDIMNTTDNNIVLMILLFLIPSYAILIAAIHDKVPERTYPPMIFLISISLLLLLSLRSTHIIGADVHLTYNLFQLTSAEEHWHLFEFNAYNACLSISLLPAIYQSLISIDSEYLFKILFSLLFSISPLVVYVISRKYIGNFYAFLASLLFMSQIVFLNTALNARTNIAILFFSLAIMVLFRKGIDKFRNRLLFVILSACCIVSHYSTTYIFLFVLVLAWIGLELLSAFINDRSKQEDSYSPMAEVTSSHPQFKALAHGSNAIVSPAIPNMAIPPLKRSTTVITLIFFFAFLFLWYAQVTEAPFDAGMSFVRETTSNLSEFFVAESRQESMGTAMGQDIMRKEIPHRIEFVFSWLTIALVIVGVLGTIARYKNAVHIPGRGLQRLPFLRTKIHAEYLAFALACFTVLVFSVAFVLEGYSMYRTYFQMMAVISPFFIIGGIFVARFLRTKPHWIILAILIPYYMCTTGIMYQIFDFPREVTLNAEGEKYDYLYVHDEETCAARWLKDHAHELETIYTDHYGDTRLISQAGIRSSSYAQSFIEHGGRIKPGYFYLRYSGVVKEKLMAREHGMYIWYDISEYEEQFAVKNRIYSNSGSEIYR